MEISDEMREAMRILKEDMEKSEFTALRKRLDEIEDKHSERDAEWKKRDEEWAKRYPQAPPKEAEPAAEDPNAPPTPPPVVEPTPEPEKKGRKRWHESGIYSS